VVFNGSHSKLSAGEMQLVRAEKHPATKAGVTPNISPKSRTAFLFCSISSLFSNQVQYSVCLSSGIPF